MPHTTMNLPIIKKFVMRRKLIWSKVLIISIVSMATFSCLKNTNYQEYIGYTKNELWMLLCEQAGSEKASIVAFYYAENKKKSQKKRKGQLRHYAITSADALWMPEEFLRAYQWTGLMGGRDKFSIVFDKRNIVIKAKMYTLLIH